MTEAGKERKIEVFQTPSGKKKGIWHIFKDNRHFGEELRCINPICGQMGYYIKGYHKDHPEMTGPEITEYDGSQELCKSCVMEAYKRKIKI